MIGWAPRTNFRRRTPLRQLGWVIILGEVKPWRGRGAPFYDRASSKVLTCALSAVLLPQIKHSVKTMAEKSIPSGSETKLSKLRQDYEALKAQIQALGYVIPGTLQKRQYSCGKPNCRCMTEGILHGPYYKWTRKISGKTVNINLDTQLAKLVKDWIQNNRKLRQLCRRLEKTSLAVLQTTTTMDKT
jgi:hypothetical protein